MPVDQKPSDSLFASESKRNLILCLLLVTCTLAIYNAVNQNGFVNYDDDVYVTANRHVQGGLSGSTLSWAFTTFDAANWHPLTWVSHALDYHIFKLNPAGHHYISLLLHCVNVVLLFLLLAERYERGSVLLSSNLPFSGWEAIFKDAMTTAAAIDRLVHHSVIVELNVPSYRAEQAKKAKQGRIVEPGGAAPASATAKPQ